MASKPRMPEGHVSAMDLKRRIQSLEAHAHALQESHGRRIAALEKDNPMTPEPPDAVIPYNLYGLIVALEAAARLETCSDVAAASKAVHAWVQANNWTW